GPRDHALPRRLALPLRPRSRLPPAALALPLAASSAHRLPLAAGDAAAAALRPADELRLEDPAPGGNDQRARDSARGGLGELSPQPVDQLKGFGVTFKQIFKKPLTMQYPEYKRPVYPRFRGRHRLWRHENGLEKCVG